VSAIESFRAGMARHGLEYAGSLCADGKLHRVKVAGDKERNSWYVLHAGPPIAAGAYGCWKRGINEQWCAVEAKSMSETQSTAVRKQWQAADAQRKRGERERQDCAQAVGARLYDHAQSAELTHPYLATKGVQPHGDLRQGRDGRLIVPLRDAEGVLHSVQLIAADGTKRYLTGGRVQGCSYTVADRPDGPLVLCEGYATGASILEATDYAVVCGMSAGNLLGVAQALRAKSPEREIIIAADNDQWPDADGKPKPNAGVEAATKTALTIGARLAVPQFEGLDLNSHPTDFNDLARLEGLPAVAAQLAKTKTPQETDKETFERLAALSGAEYDRVRKAEAQRLGIREPTLDEAVAKLRKWTSGSDRTLQGHEVDLGDVEPWPEPVDGAAVLDAVSQTCAHYVALPPGAADALALWDAHTHCFDAFEHSPRLAITSPEKGCGKTTLRDVVAMLVPRPLPAESLTPAVLFRVVEKRKPTVLADEYDSWLGEAEELRGMLNAGHKRGGQALRCEGDDHEVRAFNVFGPVVLCGIGALPGTLHDRSITIRLTRAKPGEVSTRFDSRKTAAEQELCRKLARWTADNRERIATSDPALPSGAFNRLADNWRPLFAVAEVAGGNWPTRAAKAFGALTATEDLDGQGIGTMLLADIAAIFASTGEDRLQSAKLAEALAAMEGRPWPEWSKPPKPISANQIARQLRRFSVSPRTIKLPNGDTAKGYHKDDFVDAFDRFLPSPRFSDRNPVTEPVNIDRNEVFEPSPVKSGLRLQSAANPNKDGHGYEVTVQKPPSCGNGTADEEILL
jgi:putative DNA primase/helicase